MEVELSVNTVFQINKPGNLDDMYYDVVKNMVRDFILGIN